MLALTVKHLPETDLFLASPIVFTFSIPIGNNRTIQIIFFLDNFFLLCLNIFPDFIWFLPKKHKALFHFVHLLINDILGTGHYSGNLGFYFDGTQCHLEFNTPTQLLSTWFLDKSSSELTRLKRVICSVIYASLNHHTGNRYGEMGNHIIFVRKGNNSNINNIIQEQHIGDWFNNREILKLILWCLLSLILTNIDIKILICK
mmetsp:Transcript_7420/g.16819  ORF Transcript_7420/g.16819 Transcript_7420/m.16819 type:complete len:202 (+) Transcript_7420:2907-3512(+)